MDVRATVAVVLAVVVAVLAVVSAGALGSPVAWAAAAVLVVAGLALLAAVTLTPGMQRALVLAGAVLAVVALVVAVAEIGVRGFRSDSTAPLLGLAAGLAGLLVVLGVAGGRSAPSPAVLWRGAAGLAALSLVVGIVVAVAVPYLPQSRAVTYTTADAVTTLTLDPPEGVTDGDVLVAQVFRSGAGEVRASEGWTALRTTALPNGAGSVTLFTTTAQDENAPATFTVDTPATLLGGIAGWGHIAGVSAPGETTGTGGEITAAPAGEDTDTQVLYFVAGIGVADVVPPAPLNDAWTVKADNVVKATTALVTRPALAADPSAPVTLSPSAPLAPWAVQTVVLQAD